MYREKYDSNIWTLGSKQKPSSRNPQSKCDLLMENLSKLVQRQQKKLEVSHIVYFDTNFQMNSDESLSGPAQAI